MKYGGIEDLKEETWQSLLSNANSDFISMLLLWYSGINMRSTYFWMFSHTIEKYLKSYLLKPHPLHKETLISTKELKSIREKGHSIGDLWNKYKEATRNTSTTKPKLNEAFDQIIKDISTIKTKTRYSSASGSSSDGFLYFYIVLCSLLRHRIIGKTEYRKSLYGLEDSCFYPMIYSPTSEGYGKIIVKKMLHVILEHAGSFTNLGSVNNMNLEEYSISNTAIGEKLKDCPICKGSSTDKLSMIKFYRDIHPEGLKKDTK
ncbi:MAG: hypothetical protein JW812_02175 [Alphaproteobacteria bacterium]|nr:hypothetical protein [Alphaproteobacteria bacterium]MBN2779438.1 hypothetical protein [Alphaproteobacteria bacterium]